MDIRAGLVVYLRVEDENRKGKRKSEAGSSKDSKPRESVEGKCQTSSL